MKRLQVAHKSACGPAPGRLVGHAPHCLLFRSHPLTSGFSWLKCQALSFIEPIFAQMSPWYL